MSTKPPVVILCGGRGTRLRERTESVPKALVEIGGRPILWHVVQIYAAQGFERFLLATGYLGEAIEEFVGAQHWPDGVEVECVDTGLDTPTGGRIARLGERLEGDRFCATYADGVADVDLGALLDFHRAGGSLATMTVVRPNLQWGVAELAGERVTGFVEKPRSEHWINGGFFCLEPGTLAYVDEESVFEREPLQQLAAEGELAAYRHDGFWDCMDTYKDAVQLNDLWVAGEAPWRLPASAEFYVEHGVARVRKVQGGQTRGRKAVEHLREAGRRAEFTMTTEEIMRLTRGEDWGTGRLEEGDGDPA